MILRFKGLKLRRRRSDFLSCRCSDVIRVFSDPSSQAKSEEALLQMRADLDLHVTSGRNEHAQISSKLESETQTRNRLESEVRHAVLSLCIKWDRSVVSCYWPAKAGYVNKLSCSNVVEYAHPLWMTQSMRFKVDLKGSLLLWTLTIIFKDCG